MTDHRPERDRPLCRTPQRAAAGLRPVFRSPLVILLVFLAATAYAADPAQVWEQVVQAKGGRERLHAVHSLAIYMHPAQVVFGGPLTSWLCVFPNRYFEFDGRSSANIQRAVVVDADADRVSIDATGQPRSTRHLKPPEHDRLVLNQLVFLVETAWQKPTLVSLKHRTLSVQAGGIACDLYLDKAMLPERIVAHATEDEHARTIDDYHLQHYHNYQGIQLPSRVDLIRGTREFVWDVDYELDARFKPSFFERTPDLANGPEPWH
jgi:hypothetical protein